MAGGTERPQADEGVWYGEGGEMKGGEKEA